MDTWLLHKQLRRFKVAFRLPPPALCQPLKLFFLAREIVGHVFGLDMDNEGNS